MTKNDCKIYFGCAVLFLVFLASGAYIVYTFWSVVNDSNQCNLKLAYRVLSTKRAAEIGVSVPVPRELVKNLVIKTIGSKENPIEGHPVSGGTNVCRLKSTIEFCWRHKSKMCLNKDWTESELKNLHSLIENTVTC